MPEHSNTPTPKKRASGRTSARRQGQRPTGEQKRQAQEAFLKSFANSGNVRAACMAAGIDRSTIYAWAEIDEQFSIQYNLAKQDVDDAIRAEIFRRAMYGEEEVVTSMGKPVYEQILLTDPVDGTLKLDKNGKPMYRNGKMVTQKRRSDILLMFQAKARMPEYREKQQVEHSGYLEVIQGARDALLADLATLPDASQSQEHHTSAETHSL